MSRQINQKHQQDPNIVQETISGQSFILLPKKGKLIELNKTASLVWRKLKKPQNIIQLTKLLCQKFDVAVATAEKDVRATIEKLSKLKLIREVKKKDKPSKNTKNGKKK